MTASDVADVTDATVTTAAVTAGATPVRALPPAPLPEPRRQLLVGTALVSLAGSTLIGGMLGIWLLMRERAVDAGERFPGEFAIPEVPSNVMLITIVGLCLFAQWTVYAAKRADRANIGLSLGLVGIMGIAFINAQAFVYFEMGMPIAEGGYPGMFYAITGTMELHGVRGKLEFPATFEVEPNHVVGRATLDISAKAFGINYAGMEAELAEDAVALEVELVFPR